MTEHRSGQPRRPRHILTLHAPNASAEDIIAGLVAAQAIFDANGTTATESALADHKREFDDVNGCFVSEADLQRGVIPPQQTATKREMAIANAWIEAGQAALTACYGERPIHEDAQLILHTAPDRNST
jgi:hypothetical protein